MPLECNEKTWDGLIQNKKAIESLSDSEILDYQLFLE